MLNLISTRFFSLDLWKQKQTNNMKTIEIEVKLPVKTKTKKVNIELPYYTKDICHYYKIVDEGTVICVTDTDYRPGVNLSYIDHALKEKKTTEKQFNDAYSRVMKKIEKHVKP